LTVDAEQGVKAEKLKAKYKQSLRDIEELFDSLFTLNATHGKGTNIGLKAKMNYKFNVS